jgi:ATP-dependent helicase/nuclease subunit A
VRRRGAAESFLRARAGDLDDDARRDLIDRALAVLDSPTLAPLFGANARAEATVTGTVMLPNGKSRAVLGQIDRLAETETEIIVADYKTGAPVAADATPESYLAQMALYRAMLAPLWPGKPLRIMLVWTEGPKIVEISNAQLDAALAGID